MRKIIGFLILVFAIVIAVEVFLYLKLQKATLPTNTKFNEDDVLTSFRLNNDLKHQGILISSTSEYTYQYKILDLEIYPEPKFVPEVKKEVKALIKYNAKNDWLGITLTEHDLTLLTIQEEGNDQSTTLSLNDLKPGDTIRYTLVFDPLKSPIESIKKIVITRISKSS